MLICILCLFFVEIIHQKEIQNVIVPSPSTARIYQENQKKYIGFYFKPLKKIISDFFENDSLYIKLSPIPYNKIFDQFRLESELILTLNLLNRSESLNTINLNINIVEENSQTGIITNLNIYNNRTTFLSNGNIESFTLPEFNISNIDNLYLKIDGYYIAENGENIKIRIPYKSNPYIMILLQYSENIVKYLKSQIRTRGLGDKNLVLPCRRMSLVADFSKIGWGSWVILPKSMNIYQCMGSCEYKSSFQVDMTENAVVRSLLGDFDKISRPCCVPTKLRAANFLIRNSIGVEEYQMKRLVVDACNCQ